MAVLSSPNGRGHKKEMAIESYIYLSFASFIYESTRGHSSTFFRGLSGL